MSSLFLLIPLLLTLSAKSVEKRKIIAVIDSGIDTMVIDNKYLCKGNLHKSFTKTPALVDFNGHGTNIASIIVDGIDSNKYCLAIIKYTDVKETVHENMNSSIESFNYAYKIGASHINYSSSGDTGLLREHIALKRFIRKGSIAVAAGNNGEHLSKTKCEYYPACYRINSKRYHVVGTTDTLSTNYGKEIVTVTMPGKDLGTPKLSGTSQATANFTNKLIKEGKI